MNCEEVSTGEIAEKYLLGRLDESERESFERHYFDCAACFEELQAYRALRAQLARAGRRLPAESATVMRMWPRMSVAAAGAGLVAVVCLVLWSRPSQSPPGASRSPNSGPAPAVATPSVGDERNAPALRSPLPDDLRDILKIEPPRYSPAILRESKGEARRRFRDAMAGYTRRDYASAIPGLEAAAHLDPKAPGIHFFLGTCYLLAGRTGPAIEQLTETIRLGGSPFLEESHLYLARAYLVEGDRVAAEGELKIVLGLHGDSTKEAQRLLDRLQDKSPGQGDIR